MFGCLEVGDIGHRSQTAPEDIKKETREKEPKLFISLSLIP